MRLTLFTDFLTCLWSDSAPPSATCFEGAALAAPASLHDDEHTTLQMEPAFNIDGTPMLGSFDIHGNPYGVTEPLSDESLSHGNMWDDIGSGGFGSSCCATSASGSDFDAGGCFDYSGSGWD